MFWAISAGPGGRLGHVPADLVGRRRLLLHRAGDGGLDVVDLAMIEPISSIAVTAAVRVALDRLDLAG